MINLSRAIRHKYPGREFTTRGDSEVTLLKPVKKLTKEEITIAKAEFEVHLEAIAYKKARIEAYPTIADQLDKIYHEGIDAWKADIKAVKDAHPKPEE